MKENLNIALKLLSDFNNFIDARSTFFLMRPDGLFKNILAWHFEIWEKEHEYLIEKNKLDEWSIYSEISRTLDSIFDQIEERILKERASHSFFERLKKHCEKYKKESVSHHDYVDSLLSIFYRVFFQNIEHSPERYDIWHHYFPKEWKITKNNLEDDENIISRISLQNFFQWAQERIWQSKEELDKELNDVSTNLFPEVAPILWAQILIFIFSQYSEDRIRSIVERPWNFGYIGRVRVARFRGENDLGEFAEEERAEEIKTFELAYILFEKEFSKDNLERYIQSLKNLTYPKESREDRHKERLLDLFSKMLAFVREKELPNSK